MLLGLVLAGQILGSPDVTYRGEAISSLDCHHGLTVTDVSTRPPAAVAFHKDFAELAFAGGDDDAEGLFVFVYVDGTRVALVSAKGPILMVIPLDKRAHHKIVTGSTSGNGNPSSASAACN